ncbi:MAG: hypothetical protein ACE5GA_09710, partial [Candidatus Zixiibacteriota bacterium]
MRQISAGCRAIIPLTALLSAASVSVPAQDENGTEDPRELEVRGLKLLLSYLNLRESDFEFRDDYMPPDSFSLIRFNTLNQRPLMLADYVTTVSEAAEESFQTLMEHLSVDLKSEHGPQNVEVSESEPTAMSGFN